MKIKITKIYRTTTKKDGTPLVTKHGKPYERIAIKSQEHGEQWMSGFGDNINKSWQEGDEVDIEISQRGEYLNFSMPDKVDLLEKRVKKLEQIVGGSSASVSNYPETGGHIEEPILTGGINPADVPF